MPVAIIKLSMIAMDNPRQSMEQSYHFGKEGSNAMAIRKSGPEFQDTRYKDPEHKGENREGFSCKKTTGEKEW